MRYLLIVFKAFRMCLYDNGVWRNFSVKTSQQKLRITVEPQLIPLMGTNTYRIQCCKLTSPAAASRSSRHGCDWSVSGLHFVQGAPIKNNPLEKNLYLRNCSRFFHQIYAVYRGGFRPCVQQIAFKYLV